MEDFTRLGYCTVAGSFVVFQFSFSALSPQLSLSLSPSYSSLPSVKQSEWNSRCVSTLHAVIVGLFCLYILWYDDAINANPIWGDPRLVKLNVAVTCGYLLYGKHPIIGFHKSRGVLPYFANFRLLSEFSTPFVNLRWFLDAAGWPRTSRLVLANGLAMTVVFFMVRIAVIPSYYMQVYSWYGTPEYERLGLGVQLAWIGPSIALEMLNLVWMYRIVRGFYRALYRSKIYKAA
ncbi:TLC domain-containing protein 4-B-like isoform X2 [Crotalus tigris]|uniref:TLC domain-containing protein 4-B-like isoform X2 n=1 Tax=Crotalus tigris TaxID=88082 RepID=UPI00192F1D8A|nr:TLC domain-containing protein 4-B-like isoform X2 [Crotalus tigris]